MKAPFFFVIVIILSYGKRAKGEKAFECPVACSTNVYRPVCLRGKSYANLCRLKRDICEGKIAKELYEDVEECPGYKKDEEAGGASVEAIDKNGVIFRQFIDPPDNTDSQRRPPEFSSVTSIDRSTKTRDDNHSIGREKKQLALTLDRYYAAIDVMFLADSRHNDESDVIRDRFGPFIHIRLKKYPSKMAHLENLKPASFWLRCLLEKRIR